jgi:tetratricopeptide (TPR) repeat protein
MTPPIQRTLGKYEILEEIGKGGFATVYRARDPDLDRVVALKVLDPLLTRDAVWVARFRREARAVAKLDHLHVVTIHEVGQAEGMLYIATRLVEGGSLSRRIAEQGALPWDEVVRLVGEIASALDYAHGQGVVHRDLKASNVLLDEERGALLTDFGFARMVAESSFSVSISGGVVGTPQCIAPEVWEGQPATPHTDVYALGCILYEMVVGEHLFQGDTTPAVMRAHFKPLDLPEEWPEGVPSGLKEVLETALAKEPEARYARAGELAEAVATLKVDALVEPYAGLEAAVAAGDWERALALANQIAAQDLGYRDVATLEEKALHGQEQAARAREAATWRAEAERALAEGDRQGAEMAARQWQALTPDDPKLEELLAHLLGEETVPKADESAEKEKQVHLLTLFRQLRSREDNEDWLEALKVLQQIEVLGGDTPVLAERRQRIESRLKGGQPASTIVSGAREGILSGHQTPTAGAPTVQPVYARKGLRWMPIWAWALLGGAAVLVTVVVLLVLLQAGGSETPPQVVEDGSNVTATVILSADEAQATLSAPDATECSEYEDAGDLESAAECLRLVTIAEPDSFWAYDNLARVYGLLEEWQLALEAMQEGLGVARTAEDQAEAYLGIGHAYYRMGDYESAIENLYAGAQIEQSISGNECNLYIWLAWAYQANDQKAEACLYFQQALDLATQVDYAWAANHAQEGLQGCDFAQDPTAQPTDEAKAPMVTIDASSFKDYPAVWFSPSTGETIPYDEEAYGLETPPDPSFAYWIEPGDPEFDTWSLEYDVEFLGFGNEVFEQTTSAARNHFEPSDDRVEFEATDSVYLIRTPFGACVIQVLEFKQHNDYLMFRWKGLESWPPPGVEIYPGERKKVYSINPEFPNDRTADVIDVYVQCLSCASPDFQVTKGDGNYDDAIWSPDGTMIAALRGPDCWSQELVVMSSDGAWQHTIGVEPFCREISWSPTSDEIAFNAVDGSLAAVDLLTGKVRTILPASMIQNSSKDIMDLSWSPDGSRLTFWTRMAEEPNDETGWEIWVVDADGSNLLNLREAEENYGQLDVHWTSDGERITYGRLEMAGSERVSSEIWVMDADGGNRHPVQSPMQVKLQVYYPDESLCDVSTGWCSDYSWDRD